jgi:hypothetical protein
MKKANIVLLLVGIWMMVWILLYHDIQAQNESRSSSSSDVIANNTITSDSSENFRKLINSVCNVKSDIEVEAINDNGLTYLNPYYGIVMRYPSDWTYQESEESLQDTKSLPIVTFYPPLTADPTAETNLQIWIENLDDPETSLEQYARNVIKSYRETSSNFTLIYGAAANRTISNDMPAYEIAFADYANNLQRKSVEIGTISNASGSVYYITFNTDASLYNEFSPLIKNMISSFGVYDHNPSAEEPAYIEGYNEGLEFMIRACLSPEGDEIAGGNKTRNIADDKSRNITVTDND